MNRAHFRLRCSILIDDIYNNLSVYRDQVEVLFHKQNLMCCSHRWRESFILYLYVSLRSLRRVAEMRFCVGDYAETLPLLKIIKDFAQFSCSLWMVSIYGCGKIILTLYRWTTIHQ